MGPRDLAQVLRFMTPHTHPALLVGLQPRSATVPVELWIDKATGRMARLKPTGALTSDEPRRATENKKGGADNTSAPLREALNSPMQQSGLTLAVQAAPFKGSTAKDASIALAIEIDGEPARPPRLLRSRHPLPRTCSYLSRRTLSLAA